MRDKYLSNPKEETKARLTVTEYYIISYPHIIVLQTFETSTMVPDGEKKRKLAMRCDYMPPFFYDLCLDIVNMLPHPVLFILRYFLIPFSLKSQHLRKPVFSPISSFYLHLYRSGVGRGSAHMEQMGIMVDEQMSG